jgi:hypothetical protein
VDHEQWVEKEGELTKSIQGKVAKNQDIERPKSCKPGSGKQEKTEKSDLEASQTAHGFTRESMDFRDLYEVYSESRVVLLPVEPYLIHAYWEVTHNDIEKAKQRLGDDYGQSQAVLRFYDITDIIFDGTNAHGTFDMDIDLQSKNWYIDLWSPDKLYLVDLGFKTGDGFFLPVTRSNIARTPCAWPASKVDEHYMLVAEDAENGLSKIKVPEEPIRDDLIEALESNISVDSNNVPEEPICDDLIEAGKAEAKAEIRKVEPLKEEERPEEDKNARPINLPQSIPRKLSGPRELQIRRKPSLNSELPWTKSIQAQFEKKVDFDLTEMSEKGLALGISSELISSTQGKNDSADCV